MSSISKDARFRLIFKKLKQNAKLEKLVAFFQKELGMPKNNIRSILTNPPRIILEDSTHNNAVAIQDVLLNLGYQTYLESVTSDPSYPFAISEKHQKAMKRELSKILRCKCNLILLLVQVTAKNSQLIIPSMMGSFEEELTEHVRWSDTVIGIDDNRIIIFGVSTDKPGAKIFQKKVIFTLKKLLGQDILISMGFSLFPDEAQSLPILMHLAEMDLKKGGNNNKIRNIKTNCSSIVSISTKNKGKQLTPIQLYFTEARGKAFHRLLDMEERVLWLGLSQIAPSEQKKFINRLPFDSPIAPILKKMISVQPQPIYNKAEKLRFEAIICQMQFEKSIEKQKKIRNEILLKLKHIEVLPILPSIAVQIFQTASNPDSSASDLSKIILNDTALTSKILKVVNSAFYGFSQEIGTLHQAVVILGMNEITDIALGAAASRAFDTAPTKGVFDLKAIWNHSMRTALISKNLCSQIPKYEKQKLKGFTVGLLHDFGKIFLAQNFHEIYERIHIDCKKRSIPLFELEEENFGLNHATIGKTMASNWNLPEYIVQAIAFHHQPLSDCNHQELAAIVGLADYLCHEITLPEKRRQKTTLFSKLTLGHWSVLAQLFTNLDTERIEKMKEDASDVVKKNDDLLRTID